jgi:sulfite exporter TauE/SafE
MNELIVAFITGLTTGGLSCLAVQGGLLASSLEHQLEQDLAIATGKKRKAKMQQARQKLAMPILLFLGAKIFAYTLLGLLLGALGSVFQLTNTMRAILLIAIGIFMIGNALRMFNVHPIFRYFVIEPPKFITRFVRRTAKNEASFTPIFLGALTVLIPCGVTQAMMAVAITTANPMEAAALMFAFTLGTSPVFFFVSYLATQLGAALEKNFMRFVAVVILILGVVSIDSGSTLMGNPYSLTNLMPNLIRTTPDTTYTNQAVDGVLTLYAQNEGYFPRKLVAKAGEALTLNVVTNKTYSCARDFVIPALGEERLLPESGTVTIAIPAQRAGTRMQFTCSMGMYTGYIEFR